MPAEELECVMNFDCNNDPKTLFLIDGSTGIMSLALNELIFPFPLLIDKQKPFNLGYFKKSH